MSIIFIIFNHIIFTVSFIKENIKILQAKSEYLTQHANFLQQECQLCCKKVFINNLYSISLTKFRLHQCERNLSDASLVSSLTENFHYSDEENRDFSYSKRVLRSQRPVNERNYRGLTRNDVIKLINSCGIFVVKKKKIYYALHVFNEYLKSLYLDMMNELWRTYKKVATEYGMPKKEQMLHWKICETELLINLLEIEEYSQKDLYSFTKRSIICSLSVDIFRLLHESDWLGKIKMLRIKWSKYLFNQVKKYKLCSEDHASSEIDTWLKDHASSEVDTCSEDHACSEADTCSEDHACSEDDTCSEDHE